MDEEDPQSKAEKGKVRDGFSSFNIVTALTVLAPG
jgi:hypothetical protein